MPGTIGNRYASFEGRRDRLLGRLAESLAFEHFNHHTTVVRPEKNGELYAD